MGFIRFLLAVSIIAAHTGGILGWTFVGGKVAVQTFFIISGFYMALILNKKYTGSGAYSLFVSNRFLRIYPDYFFILLISIVFYLSTNTGPIYLYHLYFATFDFLLKIYLVLSQLTIIGLDWSMYLGVSSLGHPYFTTNYLSTKPILFDFLVIPQAWTLSFELLFYLFIPFIYKRTWVCIFLIVVSIVFRIGIYAIGLHAEPWTNRFFPTELTFFLLGVLVYNYQNSFFYHLFSPTNAKILFGICIVFLCIYEKIPYISYGIDIKQALFYSFFIVGLPGFFMLFKKSTLDYSIGELSYPMYIAHILVSSIILFLPVQTSQHGLWTLIATILLSIGMYYCIDRPIDRYRQSRVLQKRNVLQRTEKK